MGVTSVAATTTRAEPATSSRWLRRLAWATLVVNVGIVVTGGVVRVTGSGLGCPTWPTCTGDSLVPHRALGAHGVIEFGNRLLTYVLAAVAIATLVAAWRRGGVIRWLALAIAIGIPAQAVIGGVSVLTDLNPWVVSLHLVASMAMICLAVWLIDVVHAPARRPLPTFALRWVPVGIFVAGAVVLYAGTVVTGAGPHAGDADSPRNGLDVRAVSQLHVDFVMVLVGLTLAWLVVVFAVGAADRSREAALTLLGVEAAQAVIGFVQYFAGLPTAVVILHLLGASLLAAAMTWVLLEAVGKLRSATSGATESARP